MSTQVAVKTQSGLTVQVPLIEVATGQLVPLDYDTMPVEARKKVDEIEASVDWSNTASLLTFQSTLQQRMPQLADEMMNVATADDVVVAGKELREMVLHMKGMKAKETINGSWMGNLFWNLESRIESLKTKYTSIAGLLDEIADRLGERHLAMVRNVQLMDDTFQNNMAYYVDLSIVIVASERALTKAKTLLAKLRADAEKIEDQQLAMQAAAHIQDFDGKIRDFERTIDSRKRARMVCLTRIPRIRSIQSKSSSFISKIQDATGDMLAMWKEEVAMLLANAQLEQTGDALDLLTDHTEELLKNSVATMRTTALNAQTQIERAIVAAEIMDEMTNNVIASIEECAKIADEYREARSIEQERMVENSERLKVAMIGNHRSSDDSRRNADTGFVDGVVIGAMIGSTFADDRPSEDTVAPSATADDSRLPSPPEVSVMDDTPSENKWSIGDDDNRLTFAESTSSFDSGSSDTSGPSDD